MNRVKLYGLKCDDLASIEHNIQFFTENSNTTIDVMIAKILVEDASSWIAKKINIFIILH